MEKRKINITVDGIKYQIKEGKTILESCKDLGISIPSLCYLKDISSNASCGVCVVEVKGAKTLVRSCVTNASEGMEIKTHSPSVNLARITNLQLLLANHPTDCLVCERNGNCELQDIASVLGVNETPYDKTKPLLPLDESSLSLIRDPNKCILCGRCVAVCAEMQTVYAIDFTGRGLKSKITTYKDKGLGNVACTNCGQCALVCPTGAIVERNESSHLLKDIYDENKVVIVQTAPAIRVGIGEAMGMEDGALVTGQMVAALRRLGFDKVFDTQFTADLTIMEEGHELIKRLTTNGKLPMVTSCSPGWIKFIEHFYPKSLAHLSTCKSPQQMFGAVAKTYYAEKMGIDPRRLVVVSIMPCTAKKFECKRPEMNSAYLWWKEKMNLADKEAFFDVDYVLTTRELAKMFKMTGVDFKNLPEEDFDHPLGISTGAGAIFAATGGVMEAAVRTAYEVVAGKPLPDLNLRTVRGFDGIKEAELDINGTKLKVAVAHTLKNARVLLDQIEEGKSPYAFIEVMTCPGGCLGGGGQPIPTTWEIRQKRADSIYREDALKPVRKSHENPAIMELYTDFLKEPLGHISHELLHTEYIERGIY
ncbi:MAG: NADH-dependent [FeFe] hydrogenase, group A6 [Bacteroidales bacterium]|jgi:iron-only hydrogenase group A|nr:NADH-dependent [FeFe] hydrogenase, group A6 [Bacteroidales bacterium]MDD3273662.1 NADH-dependent [FeFe] hydrogenase, group A6 [Bacteroidales bacterium]MDD4057567.1 NADH-dependent [FeFe] hydrogenase, group A6 [Bacteroidales bacterium]